MYTFIDLFAKAWKIINAKTPIIGYHKRDPACESINSVNDWKLTFLEEFANFLERWQKCKQRGLT